MITAIISRDFVQSQNQYTINGERDKAMDEEHVLDTLVMGGKMFARLSLHVVSNMSHERMPTLLV